jgi:hypothetical protein
VIRPTAPVRRQRRFRFRLVFTVVAATLLCGWLTPPAAAAPPAGYYLVWGDEFNAGGYGASFTATHPPGARSRVGVGF